MKKLILQNYESKDPDLDYNSENGKWNKKKKKKKKKKPRIYVSLLGFFFGIFVVSLIIMS